MQYQILRGDCISQMRQMPDNSFDSVVTDPPYELGFMGKTWDASGIAYSAEMWAEALRVLKPGGHLREGFRVTGIELLDDHADIAERRAEDELYGDLL